MKPAPPHHAPRPAAEGARRRLPASGPPAVRGRRAPWPAPPLRRQPGTRRVGLRGLTETSRHVLRGSASRLAKRLHLVAGGGDTRAVRSSRRSPRRSEIARPPDPGTSPRRALAEPAGASPTSGTEPGCPDGFRRRGEGVRGPRAGSPPHTLAPVTAVAPNCPRDFRLLFLFRALELERVCLS